MGAHIYHEDEVSMMVVINFCITIIEFLLALLRVASACLIILAFLLWLVKAFA